MQKLFDLARTYIKNMGIWDMAALKFCLCAAGIIIGLFIPKKSRKPVLFVAVSVFIATYIPLMAKLFKLTPCCSKYKSIDIDLS